MVNVTVFSKDNCPLCDKAITLVEKCRAEHPFQLEIIDIYQNDELLEKYQLMIPVVTIDGVEVDFGQISERKIKTHIIKKNGQN